MCAFRHALVGFFLGFCGTLPALAENALIQGEVQQTAIRAAAAELRALPPVAMRDLFDTPTELRAETAPADTAFAPVTTDTTAPFVSAALADADGAAAAQRPRIPAAPADQALLQTPQPRPEILRALYPAAGPAPAAPDAPPTALPRPAPSKAVQQTARAATRLLNAELKGGSADEEAERIASEFSHASSAACLTPCLRQSKTTRRWAYTALIIA